MDSFLFLFYSADFSIFRELNAVIIIKYHLNMPMKNFNVVLLFVISKCERATKKLNIFFFLLLVPWSGAFSTFNRCVNKCVCGSLNLLNAFTSKKKYDEANCTSFQILWRYVMLFAWRGMALTSSSHINRVFIVIQEFFRFLYNFIHSFLKQVLDCCFDVVWRDSWNEKCWMRCCHLLCWCNMIIVKWRKKKNKWFFK